MQEEDKCKIFSAKEEVFVRRRRCKRHAHSNNGLCEEETWVRKPNFGESKRPIL